MRASRIPVLLALAAATLAAGHGAFRILEYRVPLEVVGAVRFRALAAGLLLGTALGLLSLLREIRCLRRGERRTRAIAPLRSLLVACVIAWIGFLALVESAEELWVDLAVGVAGATWIAWIAVEGPSPRAAGGFRKAIGVVAFSLAASALLLEIALRLYATSHPSPLLARLGDPPRTAVERVRFAPGRMWFGFPCNQGGHYDVEFLRRAPGERLVVTIGDSFSIGVVPHALHFTTVCERELGVPVDNMGIIGVGPPEYLDMLVDEALPLDPSVIVVDLFVGNDFVFPPKTSGASRALARSWLERGNVLLWIVPTRLARVLEERRERSRQGGRIAVVQGQEARDSRALEEAYPWLADPRLEADTFSEAAYLAIERRRARETGTLTASDLEPLHGVLLEMKRAAGSIPLCVMLIPDEFQIEDEVWRKVCEEAESERNLDRDRPQKLIVPWLEANGIPCLDLTPILRAAEPLEDGNRHLYHLRDTHFNARGNRVAGEALAKFLAERLPPAEAR
jgi:hypothetical protein